MASGDSIDTIEVVETSFMKNNMDMDSRIKYMDGDDEGTYCNCDNFLMFCDNY